MYAKFSFRIVCYLFLVTFLGQYSVCNAQKATVKVDVQSILNQAKQYRYGIGCAVDRDKAKDLYLQAIASKSVRAMVHLGVMYLEEKNHEDSVKACTLFQKAAKRNNIVAKHQLGHLYMFGSVLPQNFSAANQLYHEAALKDSSYLFDVGYLYYKGYAGEQNYTKAIECFQKAAKYNSLALYFLGYCYLQGFGVPQNPDKAREYFEQASDAGNLRAKKTLNNHWVEYVKTHPHPSLFSLTDVKRRRFNPETMPVSGNTFNLDSLEGEWVGKVYTYDWSHKIVLYEEDMALDIQSENGVLKSRRWINGIEKMQFTAEPEGTKWRIAAEHDTDPAHLEYRLDSFTFQLHHKGDSVYLTGNVDRIFKKDNEPYRPTYFILDREKQGTIASIKTMSRTSSIETGMDEQQFVILQDTAFSITQVYPNPFDNQINIDFSVSTGESVCFQIYNVSGLLLYSSPKKTYNAGAYSVVLTPSLPKGNYILVASGSQYVYTKKIIKK